MEFWIAKLREQAAQIAAGEYQPGTPAFTRAPAGMAELSRDIDQLASVMADRDRAHKALTREVHHRVKNNLQIVTSLLRMQASKVQDPAISEALGQAHSRMGALALIHRMLYEQSDEGDQGGLDLSRLMTELCAQMHLWYLDRVDVKFICGASSVAVPLDSAMPLALFAVEAVSNAYSHAFPGRHSGEVTLHFSVDGYGDALLRVVDDGVGFDSHGDAKSMGRQLMNAFAHQLGGSCTITSSALNGTEVRLAYRIGDQAPQPAT